MYKQMRSDLADEGVSIPAFDGLMRATYLEADAVKGAKYDGTYGAHYTRLKLRDNRVFYFIDADLENCDAS